jgi:phosphonate utilization associated putative membrane protein
VARFGSAVGWDGGSAQPSHAQASPAVVVALAGLIGGMPIPLPWDVVLVVLFAALLHAGWNALVKSSPDKALDTAALHVMGALIVVPILAVTGLPPAAAWPFLVGSMLIHVGYYVSLTGAYEHGDLGLTYPLMRGLGPMLVALSSGLLIGEQLSPAAWAGAGGICAGVLLLGLSRQALARPKALAFALANATAIAMYTVVDGLGVRVATQAGGNALQYVATLFLLNGWPFTALVVHRRGSGVAWSYLRRRAPMAALGATASLAAYGISLWAMTRAPVAVVAALRETSVLFAALLGTWLLKEVFTLRRALGTAVIVTGVVALRVG